MCVEGEKEIYKKEKEIRFSESTDILCAKGYKNEDEGTYKCIWGNIGLETRKKDDGTNYPSMVVYS